MKYVGLAVRLGAAVLPGGNRNGPGARKTAFSLTAVAAYSEVKTGEDVYVKVTFLNNLNRLVTLEFASPLCDYLDGGS